MSKEEFEDLAEIDDAFFNATLWPDGYIQLRIERGGYTHYLRISPSGHKCEVNTVKNKPSNK